VIGDTWKRRSIWWDGDSVAVLDQRYLPHEVLVAHWHSLDTAAAGIVDMQVRGAPLIGVAAAHGIALAMQADPSDRGLLAAGDKLLATRPTAVNLRWAVQRVTKALLEVDPGQRLEVARQLAQQLADEDAAACRAIGEHGLALLGSLVGRDAGQPVQVLTHCNAGRIACVEWGTATAPVYLAAEAGIPVHVWVSETRPRNQGAFLTAWELGQAGIPHTVIADNAAGHLLASGMVHCCLVGTDRVAANGDVANKIGTYLKALAAHDNGVPFYVASPVSTVDPDCPSGADIPIEERSPDEVRWTAGWTHRGDRQEVLLTPEHSPARNWGFDVTPARYVTAIVTERGVIPATPEGVASLRSGA
jgi:methylthioribose-1-phosphate isomerase